MSTVEEVHRHVLQAMLRGELAPGPGLADRVVEGQPDHRRREGLFSRVLPSRSPSRRGGLVLICADVAL
ncbi:MAG: hypothetical protein ACR2HR_17250 [Euzebya sp.]